MTIAPLEAKALGGAFASEALRRRAAVHGHAAVRAGKTREQAKARILLHLPSENLIKDGLLLKLGVSG